MTAMSRKFLIVGAGLMTAHSRMRMRRVAGAADRQEKTRISLVSNLAKTSFWRETGIEPRLHEAEFRKRVPLRTYEDFADSIERTKRGDVNVFWPGSCSLFAISSASFSLSPNGTPRL
jgi:hypothetical protein